MLPPVMVVLAIIVKPVILGVDAIDSLASIHHSPPVDTVSIRPEIMSPVYEISRRCRGIDRCTYAGGKNDSCNYGQRYYRNLLQKHTVPFFDF